MKKGYPIPSLTESGERERKLATIFSLSTHPVRTVIGYRAFLHMYMTSAQNPLTESMKRIQVRYCAASECGILHISVLLSFFDATDLGALIYWWEGLPMVGFLLLMFTSCNSDSDNSDSSNTECLWKCM